MIKLFATDLDGTILNGFYPDEFCLETIDMVLASKKYFVISTGRPLFPHQIESMGFGKRDLWYLCMNGAAVRRNDGSLVHQQLIDKTEMRQLMETFDDVILECFTMDHISFNCSREEYIAYRQLASDDHMLPMLNSFIQDAEFDQSIDQLCSKDIIKINCRFLGKQERRPEMEAFIANTKTLLNSPFTPSWCEVTDKKANKGDAVKTLITMLGLREDEVAVFGDGDNDASMLSKFENAYVPENGQPAVKVYAKEITECCKNHGVLKKMRELCCD